MIKFHETVRGKRFFDGQLPKLINTLERIANALEKQDKPIIEEIIEEKQVCEWEFAGINDIWKPSCKSHNMNVSGLTWFKICPYCGKEMKLK